MNSSPDASRSVFDSEHTALQRINDIAATVHQCFVDAARPACRMRAACRPEK
jgi:hypothetical protein